MRNILLLLFIPVLSFSQNIDNLFSDKGELYFSFNYTSKNQLNELSDIISIDHKTNSVIAYAYANKEEFQNFLEKKIYYTIIKKEKLHFTPTNKSNWNYYPT